MSKSAIEWTESTWNPLTGCNKISPGCKNCYAERMAKRLQAMGQEKYRNGFRLTLHPDVLEEPLGWTKPQMIFVNSMSDLFHKDVPVEFIQRVFNVMCRAHWHTFQVLTKRAERLLELDSQLDWPANVWMGVSVENSDYKFRIDLLRQTHARIKFLSLEPLLGPLPEMNLSNIDWVIVGGNLVRKHDRFDLNGCKTLEINVFMLLFRSSLNNGAAQTGKRQADCWMGRYGMGFQTKFRIKRLDQ